MEGSQLRFHSELKIEGNPRVTDPTLIEHDGRIYLFGALETQARTCCTCGPRIRIEAQFTRHPASPVRISPRARAWGSFLSAGDRLIRLGQDFSSGYGDGLIAFETEVLSPTEYREREVGTLRFADRRGPHTLNWADGEILFDWYRDRFSPLAGLRRLSERTSSRP